MALGLVTAATLMLQIIETKIISVISWYHLHQSRRHQCRLLQECADLQVQRKLALGRSIFKSSSVRLSTPVARMPK